MRHQAALLLIALWLGAGLFFAAAVAPAAFAVLPTSELAGRIVGRTLSALNISGAVVSFVLLFAAWWKRRSGDKFKSDEISGAGWIAPALMFLTTTATEFVINPRIARLRAEYLIASLSPTDPARVEFGMLHGLSVVVFGVSLLAAFAALLSIVRRSYPPR